MDTKKWKIAAAALGGAAAAGAVCGTAYYLRKNNKAIERTLYPIEAKGLPESFDGFRITQVSDLQSQNFGKDQKDLLAAVREEHPDIIVVTGDLIDRNHTDFMVALKALLGMIEIAPVYYVDGNHEFVLKDSEIKPFYEEMRMMGIHVLFDEKEAVGRGSDHINIIGLSEYSLMMAKEAAWEKGREFGEQILKERLDALFEELDDSYRILLAHEPQYLEIYAGAKPDLIFSGHAHGGQFRLPSGQGIFSPGQGLMPSITSSVHWWKDSQMVVSRGLGNSVFPFRLNNRPEVVTAVLRAVK